MMLFSIFKIIGIKLSLHISEFIFSLLGPIFRSNKITEKNLSCIENLTSFERQKIINQMWKNIGKIFAEYAFMKEFRENKNFQKIIVQNLDIIEEVKKSSEPVILFLDTLIILN